jgi:hypothetical protein
MYVKSKQQLILCTWKARNKLYEEEHTAEEKGMHEP